MRTKTTWLIGAAAFLALLLAVPAVAGHGHGHHRKMVFEGERVDLADLVDGETRTFGSGERQVTATRAGDLITISVGDTEVTHDIACDAERDDCFVVVSEDGGRVKILVDSLEGHGSSSAKEVIVMSAGGGDGGAWVVSDDEHAHGRYALSTRHGGSWVSAHACDDCDGCEECEHGEHDVLVRSVGGLDGQVLRLRAGGTMLRCPEGDTTMHLEKGEEDEGPFYCPKHDVKLEEVKHRMRRIDSHGLHDHDHD